MTTIQTSLKNKTQDILTAVREKKEEKRKKRVFFSDLGAAGLGRGRGGVGRPSPPLPSRPP